MVRHLSLLRLSVLCLLALPLAAQELTTTTYEGLKKKIDVTPKELRWQQVEWLRFFDGLVEAQKRDRPIFYWIYFGDPRGGC